MKTPVYLLIISLLTGCSAGRYYSMEDQYEISYTRIGDEAISIISKATSCESPKSNLREPAVNTVFVHPGLMLFGLDRLLNLAVGSANKLVRNGYAKDVLTLRDRNTDNIGEQMKKDPGTRFIGLHYSMGGDPDLLAISLASVSQARQESGKDLIYYPILVDPVGIEHVNTLIDLNAMYLGQMFIVLSKERSLLRPYIDQVREDILRHPKVHLIYAEDIGENWSHFDALSSVINDDRASRFRDVFFLIAHTIVEGRTSADFEEQFAFLKLKYAMEDSRPIRSSWLRLAGKLACVKESNRAVATTK